MAARTELSDEVDVRTLGEGLDERRCARLSDRAKLVDQVVLGHAAAAVDEGKRLRLLVSDQLHLELGRVALAEHRRIGERHEARLVERIRTVGDELTKEDLLLRVERVNDDIHELVDIRLELELLARRLVVLAGSGRREERDECDESKAQDLHCSARAQATVHPSRACQACADDRRGLRAVQCAAWAAVAVGHAREGIVGVLLSAGERGSGLVRPSTARERAACLADVAGVKALMQCSTSLQRAPRHVDSRNGCHVSSVTILLFLRNCPPHPLISLSRVPSVPW